MTSIKSIANKQIDARLPWGTADIADAAVTSGKLAAGSVRAGKLGTIAQRTDELPIPDGSGSTVNVDCNPGERMIGGGVEGPTPTTDGWVIYESRPLANGWQGRARNNTGGQEGFKVYALCLQGG